MNSSRVISTVVRSPGTKAKLLKPLVTTCDLSQLNSKEFTKLRIPNQPNIQPAKVPIPNSFNIASEIETDAKTRASFEKIWAKFEKHHYISIPKEILWLIGAPGSGKGTVTPYILRAHSTSNPPVCMSSLLQSPQLRAQVNAGRMVDDVCVLEHLLGAILLRDPSEPLIVDGFPRTPRQVAFVSLLHKKLVQSSFKVAILYVSQSTSLARQLQRGLAARLHNENVKKCGHGTLWEERATDCDQNLVLTRYQAFAEHMGAIMGLAHVFPFHMINADCSLDQVVANILHTFDPHYPTQSTSS